MALRVLFAVLAAGLVVIAWGAATNGQPVIAVGAIAIALWLAVSALPRRRRGG